MGVRIQAHPNGQGLLVVTHYRGVRHRKYFSTARRKAAKAFADLMQTKIQLSKQTGEALRLAHPEQVVVTITHLLTDWLATAKIHTKPSTYRGYARAVHTQLLPAFGSLPIDALKREHVKRFIAQKAEEPVGGASRAERGTTVKTKARWTIQSYLVPLKAAFNAAMDDGLVTINPVANFGKLLRDKTDVRLKMSPLTFEEAHAVVAGAKQHAPVLFPMILVSLRCGLRLGEALGLHWGDVDFRGKFLQIARAVVLGELTTPKSHLLRRIDLSEETAAVLRAIKETRELDAAMHGRELAPWVFLSPEGKPWEERNVRRTWYRLLNRLGLRRVRWHDLRHSFITHLITTGADIKYVQTVAGHSSPMVTLNTYSHLLPNRNQGSMNKLDAACRDAGNEAESATLAPHAAVVGESPTDKLLV